MPYNKGQGSFGSTRGNMWAMIRQLVEGQGSMNESDQFGGGGLQVIKGTYDFSVDGGAIGTILIRQSLIIPADFVVLGGILNPITTFTGGGGATVAVGIGSGAQAAGLKVATGFASYVAGTPLAVLPIWSGGFFVNPADAQMSITVAVAALTAGKMAINIVGVPYGT